MHIVFMEKVHTRTRGKLAQKYLDKYKSTWLKELGLRQEFTKRYERAPKDVFREKDALRKTLISAGVFAGLSKGIGYLIDKLQLPFDKLSIQHALQRFADSLQTANGLYKKDYRVMLRVHLLNTVKLSIRHSLPLLIAFFLQIDLRLQDIPLFFSASFFVDLILSALPRIRLRTAVAAPYRKSAYPAGLSVL